MDEKRPLGRILIKIKKIDTKKISGNS